MKGKTSQKIIKILEEKGQISPSELNRLLGLSDRAVRKQLKKLYEEGILDKKGKPPRVFYYLKAVKDVEALEFSISRSCKKIIDVHFVAITPTGNWKEGTDAFVYFCKKRDLLLEKSAEDYCEIFKKYDVFKKDGLIDGLAKMQSTFDEVYLDTLYYLDFYSIERFGKTKLGQMLLYAKQSQNIKFINELIVLIKPIIESLVESKKIDAVGFIPPTVKREVQIMKEIEVGLNLSKPHVSIVKVQNDIAVPQKTLSKLFDRVENAKETIVVTGSQKFNKVLLIDDAIGSGSTLNETAKQLKAKGVAKEVIGLAITGSFKGFDVISEV